MDSTLRSVGRRLIMVCAVLALLHGCGSGGGGDIELPLPPPVDAPRFALDGLEGLVIIEIRERGDRLFAATHDGLYGKVNGDTVWVPLGLDGRRVESVAIIDDMHWVAATFDPIWNGNVNPRLMVTMNGGGNWSDLVSDWGASNPDPEPTYKLLYDDATGQLYATGANVLARSDDRGTSWQLLHGQWESATTGLDALQLNAGTNQLWFGGQNGIEEMVLFRHDIGSGNTDSWLRLLPSPAVAKSVTLDPTNINRIIVSGEGGILQSFDNGASWEAPLGDVNHRFYFQTVPDPRNPAILYTIGWDKNFDFPQPLILEISQDSGDTWKQHALDDADLFGGAWSLHATLENDQTVLYAGLFRGGIYRITF